ncbi:glycosyltransferase family 2 protein [Microbacterium sp. NPDC057407]|uniref:glycosyltransferase family 2 protein n=1 Tax=Microbacterium sp. NPDC057407 TaxID=3346120 RepID=UPI0036730719
MDNHVSVVVPVGPRSADLPDQLRALARQDPAQGFDLVLSANGASQASVEAVARRVDWPEHVRVRVVDSSDRPGPGHARNVGWRHAAGTFVLFCDADDVVDDRWVVEMTSALEEAPVVGGRLDHERLNPPSLSSWGAISAHALPSKFHHLPFAGSCNLGIRRDVLEMLEGFDEHLSASEDADLCWRAQYLGHELRMAPSALVSYRRRPDARSLFAQARNDARNDARLLARHRPHGARWTAVDLAREAAGTCAAMLGAPVSLSRRLQFAARAGRLSGHLRAARAMARTT